MGSLPGATRVRFPDIAAAKLDLAHKKPIVFCHNGNRGYETCAALAAMGIDCRFLVGGLEKWLVEKRSLTGLNARTLDDLRALPSYRNQTVLLDTPDVHKLVAEDGAIFVDVRYPGEFAIRRIARARSTCRSVRRRPRRSRRASRNCRTSRSSRPATTGAAASSPRCSASSSPAPATTIAASTRCRGNIHALASRVPTSRSGSRRRTRAGGPRHPTRSPTRWSGSAAGSAWCRRSCCSRSCRACWCCRSRSRPSATRSSRAPSRTSSPRSRRASRAMRRA